MITADRLRELLVYDPDTGLFTGAQENPGKGGTRRGKVVGRVNANGYVAIKLDGKEYKGHRLAWMYMTGEWPTDEIDHINMRRSDNRLSNLRAATHGENRRNMRVRADSSIGLKGVAINRTLGKYVARVQVDGERKFLGWFTCPAAAHLAFVVAADKYHGRFARTK